MKLTLKLKHLLILTSLIIMSCTKNEEGCETETVCFGEGNCIERPIPGTCFNDDF